MASAEHTRQKGEGGITHVLTKEHYNSEACIAVTFCPNLVQHPTVIHRGKQLSMVMVIICSLSILDNCRPTISVSGNTLSVQNKEIDGSVKSLFLCAFALLLELFGIICKFKTTTALENV